LIGFEEKLIRFVAGTPQLIKKAGEGTPPFPLF
jgi:hypothetical protein